MTPELVAAARTWAASDPDPQTAAELIEVVERAQAGDAAAAADLADRFDGTLQFGTAGLRGALGAGPNRMNRVVVVRAAAGLASYLLHRGPTTGLPRRAWSSGTTHGAAPTSSPATPPR